MDPWMLYLPLSQVAGLNLNWWRKLLVRGGIFCVGLFVTVVSIMHPRTLSSFQSENRDLRPAPRRRLVRPQDERGHRVRPLPEAVSRVSKRFSSYYRLSTTPTTTRIRRPPPPGGAVSSTITTTVTSITTGGGGGNAAKGGRRHSRAVSRSLRRSWFPSKDTRRGSIAMSESGGAVRGLGFVSDLQQCHQSQQQQQSLDMRRLSSVLPPPESRMTMRDSSRVYVYGAGGDDSGSDRTMLDSWPGPHPGTLARPGTFTTGRPSDGRRLTPDLFAVSYPSMQNRGVM